MTETHSTRCVVCNHKLGSDDAMTCHRCVENLDDALADILVLYALLPAVTEPGSVQLNDMPHGKRVDAPAPVRLEITDLMDDRVMLARGKYPTDKRRGVLGVLESWGRVLREERNLSVPTEPATLAGEVAILRRHLSWLAGQPFIDEMAGEIHKVHRELEAVCGETRPKPIGKCPAMVLVNGEHATCGAPLYAPVYGDVVTCERCKTVWTHEKWRLLGRQLEEETG